jgi:hypothetical protein
MEKTVICNTCGAQFAYEQKKQGRLRRYCDGCSTPKHKAIEQVTCQRCGLVFMGPWQSMWCAECRHSAELAAVKEDRERRKARGITIVVPESKLCPKCQTVKPADAFYPKTDRPNGLDGICKECRAIISKQYVQEHPQYVERQYARRKEELKNRQQQMPDKYCSICNTILPIGQWMYCSDECRKESARRAMRVIDAAKKELKERTCKECAKKFIPEYGNKRRAFCSQDCNDRYGERVGKATRRARMYDAGEIENFDPRYILIRDGWKCYICGCKTPKKLRGTKEPNAPEVDHVIPLARGGGHTEQNVRCICRQCNNKKGAKLLSEMSVDASIQLRLL